MKPGSGSGIIRKPRAADSDSVNMDPRRMLVQYGEAEVPFISLLNPTIELPAMMQIEVVYPGSEFFYPRSRVKKSPDPVSGSASKNLNIFNPKNCF
jgi:hypothetical protein